MPNANDPGPSSAETMQLIVAFNDALNAHNVDAMMRFLAPDTVFENTYPPPDGTRYAGKAAVRAFWEDFFRSGHGQSIEIEDIHAAGNRCTMLWTYRWVDADGKAGHIRGVDVYTIQSGLIAAKLSYVKG